MNDSLDHALQRGDGLVAVALCSHSVLTRGLEQGRLARVLPGIYRDARATPTSALLARALALHSPRAVVCGRAAAAMTWWPSLAVPWVDALRPVNARPVPGYRWTNGTVDERLVLRSSGLALACPALSVLDLLPELGGAVLDRALRTRATSLDAVRDALVRTPGRRGNGVRAALLDDSRDEPWSEAERLLHRIIRGLRLPWGFRGNHRVHTGPGDRYLDAALPALRLAFEVDGYEFHADAESFEEDRLRIAELALVGWQVYPFAAVTVLRQPERTGRLIERLARRRAGQLGRDRHTTRDVAGESWRSLGDTP